METSRVLYVMLSRTNTAMGKLIRFFTHYEYNHVSLSLDPTFRQWVSFARYTVNVPLAGGFVSESPERFLSTGTPLPVRIFRIPISEERYQALSGVFRLAGQPDSGLVYNTFGALAGVLHIPCPVAGAYTCLEFADKVLGEAHLTIAQLDAAHRDQLFYAGDLTGLVPDSGCREAPYFTPCNFFRAAGNTAAHFARLTSHALFPRRYRDVADTV